MKNQILKLMVAVFIVTGCNMVAVFIVTGCNKDQKPLVASASIATKITEVTNETTKHLENDLEVCFQFGDNAVEVFKLVLRALPKPHEIEDEVIFYSYREEVITLKERIKDTYHPRHLKIKESFQSKKRAIIANDVFTQLLRISSDLEPGIHLPEFMEQVEKQIKDVEKKNLIFMAACAPPTVGPQGVPDKFFR